MILMQRKYPDQSLGHSRQVRAPHRVPLDVAARLVFAEEDQVGHIHDGHEQPDHNRKNTCIPRIRHAYSSTRVIRITLAHYALFIAALGASQGSTRVDSHVLAHTGKIDEWRSDKR